MGITLISFNYPHFKKFKHRRVIFKINRKFCELNKIMESHSFSKALLLF